MALRAISPSFLLLQLSIASLRSAAVRVRRRCLAVVVASVVCPACLPAWSAWSTLHHPSTLQQPPNNDLPTTTTSNNLQQQRRHTAHHHSNSGIASTRQLPTTVQPEKKKRKKKRERAASQTGKKERESQPNRLNSLCFCSPSAWCLSFAAVQLAHL